MHHITYCMPCSFNQLYLIFSTSLPWMPASSSSSCTNSRSWGESAALIRLTSSPFARIRSSMFLMPFAWRSGHHPRLSAMRWLFWQPSHLTITTPFVYDSFEMIFRFLVLHTLHVYC